MKIHEKQLQLKNGYTVILRSPESADVAAVNEYRYRDEVMIRFLQ